MVIEKQRGLLEILRQAQTPEEKNFLRRYVRTMKNRHGYLLNMQKAQRGTGGGSVISDWYKSLLHN